MKKALFFILSAFLILFISCQSTQTAVRQPEVQEQPAQQGAQELQGQPWTNSNIYGNWPAERPSVEQNYELHFNYDNYMKALQAQTTEDSLYSRSEEYQETKIRELIADTSKTSDELELIRAYYRLFADFEKRNKDANGPLLDYRDMFVTKTTVADLSAEVRNGLIFGNPLAAFKVDKAGDGSGKYGVWIDFSLPFSARLKQDYTDEDVQNVKAYLAYLLMLAGYEEEYAVQMVELVQQFEMKATELDAEFIKMRDLQSDALIMTLDDIKEFCAPLYDLVIGLGYYSADGEPVCYILQNAGIFYGIDQMYLDDNIQIFQAIYVIAMAEYAREFMDIATYAETYAIEDPSSIDFEEVAYRFIDKYLTGAVDQVYLEFAFQTDVRDKITELVKKYMAAMDQRLKNETWMTDATKAKALEKVRDMIYVVVYPEEWLDFSALREIVQDHDQFLLDAVLCRDDFYRAYVTSFLGKDIERGNWVFSEIRTTEANAFYVPTENSINILAGILYDTLYYEESTESVLASIGATVGHEITHGFDTGGAVYNGIGDEENWWTETDAANFKSRANRVAEELSKISVMEDCTVNGEYVLDEMVADLGGLALSLDIAKQYENFNYDEFFRYYALMWYSIKSDADAALELYMNDNHPADYIRANFSVQMFDEFYKTYPQVVEGTPMYRAPEERVIVW